MLNAIWVNSDGEYLNHLTQYDVNQKLYLDYDEDIVSPFTAPVVHFQNDLCESAIVVQSSLSDGCIVADIPNELLADPYNIEAFVYLTNESNTADKKTVIHVHIPVRPRKRPADFEQTQNITQIEYNTIVDKINEVEGLIERTIAIATPAETGDYLGISS